MKIATLPKKRRRDLIIIAILLIGLPLLVFASYQVYQLVIRASVEAQPKNVALSNVTTSSVTVSWVTDVSATGSVVPVLNGVDQSPVLDKRGSGKRYTHYVELTNLEPNTDYEFVIVSDGEKYTSEGEEKLFKFKTAPIKGETPTPNPIHGSVSGVSGDDVMLFAMLKDKSAYPVSAIMPRGGNWIIDMSALRDISEKTMIVVTPDTNIVLTAISGSEEGSVIEGTFSELFDSNGKLKDVHTLNLSSGVQPYTYFASASLLGVQVSEPIVVPEPVVTEPIIEEEEESERRYELVHDIAWTDMFTGEGIVSGVTGEDSIQITNLTDTGFTVIWLSAEKEEGYISYGTSIEDLSLEANDERDGITTKGEYYVHIVSLSRLQPETEYFFEINLGDTVYDNNGNKYTVTTFPTLTSPPPFDSVSGEIEGIPEHNEAVLIAQIVDRDDAGSQGDSSRIATAVDENGRWILSIADSRTHDGLSYFEYTSGDTLEIDVITTFSTDINQESMEGIESRDIEITIQDTGQTQQADVELLDNYGVLGVSTINRLAGERVLGVDSEGQEYDAGYIQGVQTPKTGVFNPYILISVFVLILVVFLSVLYISRMTKKCKKGNMKDNI
jgi:hypothetical protein